MVIAIHIWDVLWFAITYFFVRQHFPGHSVLQVLRRFIFLDLVTILVLSLLFWLWHDSDKGHLLSVGGAVLILIGFLDFSVNHQFYFSDKARAV